MTAILHQELQKLSVLEKLTLVEQLWSDIAPEADLIGMPISHEDELLKRQTRIASGESTFSDWEEARKRIFSKIVR